MLGEPINLKIRMHLPQFVGDRDIPAERAWSPIGEEMYNARLRRDLLLRTQRWGGGAGLRKP